MEKKKHKKVLLIVTLCVLFFASLVVWRVFFHISSDYRIAAARAVEFADEILDGNLPARAAASANSREYITESIIERLGMPALDIASTRERYRDIFDNLSSPLGRREHDIDQLLENFRLDMVYIAMAEFELVTVNIRSAAEQTAFNDPSQRHLFEKSEEEILADMNLINEFRGELLDTRNQLAEIVGIEQRVSFEILE
jgi:hypothetical protein